MRGILKQLHKHLYTHEHCQQEYRNHRSLLLSGPEVKQSISYFDKEIRKNTRLCISLEADQLQLRSFLGVVLGPKSKFKFELYQA